MATVAALAFGTSYAAAFAQDDPTSTPPTTSETTMTTPPPSSAPPPSSEPTPPPPAKAEQKNSISGVLYADKNSNGKQDPGEALEDGTITVTGRSTYTTNSGAEGRFAFADLAPGDYVPAYFLPDGWVVHNTAQVGSTDVISVVAGVTTEVAVRAERPYSEQLSATVSLDRDSYEYPASAKITVTLTNTTDRRIDGIQASCNRHNAENTLGSSNYWYLFGSPGQSIEAGQQRKVTITERIPAPALTAGAVTLDCDFAPNALWNPDGPQVHAEAVVNGGFSYTLVLGEDRNADQRIDADEALSGEKVALLDQQTGRQVAERKSGADGRVEFTGLTPGDYQAVLLSAWTFTDDSQQLVRVTGQAEVSPRFLKLAAPAALTATMTLDKPRYESHETVKVDITVKNDGGRAAERVRLFDRGFWDLYAPSPQWGDAVEDGPGVRIAAGESRTFSALVKIREFKNGRLEVSAWIEYVGMPNDGPTSFYAGAEVVQTNGDMSGVVYIDKNHNKQQDPGELAADTLVEISGGAPYAYFKTTTDANGRFSLTNIPSGDYTVDYTLAGGWIVHAENDRQAPFVSPGVPLQLTARGERPYTEALKVTTVLDNTTYVIGADAKIAITLSNKAAYPVDGVQAACISEGNTWRVSDRWGDLHSAGVTLGPGETKTLLVDEKVPESARATGRVTVKCDFAPGIEWNQDFVTGYDWALIPGGHGSVTGPLAHDRNHNSLGDPGESMPNATVRLMTDREFGGIVAETVSDADGMVRFEQVPPGTYWAQVDGPWKFEGINGGRLDVTAGQETFYFFVVVDGPPPTTPGGDDGGTGDGGWGAEGALAKTGASVLGLGAVAVLLVAFGIGARVAGRRRTS
ncbi:SdrD B-like domain-containing protein [Lentzea sp. HUAS TT2]|uniref:SdrD B-like domain-containing protein n=1 Tax=Lentzea sp. HUAS TT2 TaxID=3447454 RepID=UPI003F7133FB